MTPVFDDDSTIRPYSDDLKIFPQFGSETLEPARLSSHVKLTRAAGV
jgi:hypothetical protein